jgi:hypothetical protein
VRAANPQMPDYLDRPSKMIVLLRNRRIQALQPQLSLK